MKESDAASVKVGFGFLSKKQGLFGDFANLLRILMTGALRGRLGFFEAQ
jgi:hypothetical protein